MGWHKRMMIAILSKFHYLQQNENLNGGVFKILFRNGLW